MIPEYSALSEVSLIAAIDGPGCEEESFLGHFGLVIWISMAIYFMIGQFVICEEYFVPILAQLGDQWNMAEDVQGATLLAVGSSSPELFTALLGVIFYPDDNPGPGTNVGSAVFNLCIIIGLSAIFAPRTAKLQIIPFLRDSIAYMIGLIQLYLFYTVITPGYMDLWESILLCGWWAFYVVAVYRTDILSSRCCCCIPPEPQSFDETLDNDDDDEMDIEPQKTNTINATTKKVSTKRSTKKQKSIPLPDFEQYPDTIRFSRAIPEQNTNDVQRLLDDLDRRQRYNVDKGWVVVVMPRSMAHRMHLPISTTNNLNVIDPNDDVAMNNHLYVRRRTLLETLTYEKELRMSHAQQHPGGHPEPENRGLKVLHYIILPWTKLFHCVIPSPEGTFVTKHIYLSIIWLICWLGILTFFVVDCSEKIGECFHIPGDLLGITLLAVGSSLPDCISSIIVARQMKIDMAVANAFGSNIFDVNLCVGFSFLLGSIAKLCQGESPTIFLGDGDALMTFSELIMAAAGFLVFLWLMMWCSLFRLERWMGYVLSLGYVGYICVFSVLFVKADDNRAE